ncbi:biotin/lipoyl attachment domain-containing protein [Chloroherpeton thalassium ATCC 35110]|uniref:Biotin/lipoyl attachment domain-containing protein n=1 Tax=Chloroherpeton thalassium (strain ATCC 35110 / GB-78) TaxID=517418 RepID=B3QSD8_CHLT3|nr:biotin/lipoyl-containing protein [Chloroherpeton thalassium]ACF12529.1 biotin/lipoyl attachment domain-containing protein [Chloroherpeton thalassium ATCC 35110]
MKYKAMVGQAAKYDIELENAAQEEVSLKIDGEEKTVRMMPLGGDLHKVVYENQVFTIRLLQSEGTFTVKFEGNETEVTLVDETQLLIERLGIKIENKKASGDLKSPMPGLVVKLHVSVGDPVEKGQGLLVLEAMKMQNEIKSAVSGTVTEILVSERQPVEKNQLLLKIA